MLLALRWLPVRAVAGLPQARSLATSVTLHMPRRARLDVQQNVEQSEQPENAGEAAAMEFSGRSVVDEVQSFTNFGSIRIDSDNVPKSSDHIVKDRGGNIGSFYKESTAKNTVETADFTSLLVENEENNQFIKYSPFTDHSSSKHSWSESNKGFFFERNRSQASGKEKETIAICQTESKSVPVNMNDFEPPLDLEGKHGESDLNYFDKIVFEDSYDKFDVKRASDAREVLVDPVVRDAKSHRSDLNFIDEKYFAPTESSTCDSDINVLSETFNSTSDINKDLDEVDDQYFKINQSADSIPSAALHNSNLSPIPTERGRRKSKQTEPTTSWFSSEIDDPSKDTKQSNVKAKKEQYIFKNETEFVEGFTVGKLDKKAKKKKFDPRTAVGIEGTALEYIRKLRNEAKDRTVHPKEMLGQHLQDRFLAASSNLQTVSDNRVKARNGEEGEEETIKVFVDVKKYKPPDLEKYTRNEVKNLLLTKILYNNHDIVAVWKPYGLPMFLDHKKSELALKLAKHKFKYSLECFLPDLASKVGAEHLYEVHRLDHTTTGVVIYAKTKEMELKLKHLFKDRKIQKTYLSINNGTPQYESGVIDIPVGETRLEDGRSRMTVKPDWRQSTVISNKNPSRTNSACAVTDYSVLATAGNASFVESSMVTGRKHQIRAHLGLGLGVPILGDHKFSHVDKLGKPQRVMGDIVDRMKIKKTKARDLPIFLHARRIAIPDIFPDRNLVIKANLPHFFSKTLSTLKLKSKKF